MKKTILTTAILASIASGVAFGFTARDIQFDRDGAGGTGAITVNSFDWLPGSGLSIDSIGATPNPDGSVTTQLVAHATLGLFVYDPGGGNPVTTYSPLGTSEFTFELSVWETATGIGGGTAGFVQDSTQPSSFKIYYDPTKDASSLQGTGFGGGGDAIVILEGTIDSLTGNFTSFTDLLGITSATDLTALNPATVALAGQRFLDQFGTNDWSNPQTITDVGNGSTTLFINVSSIDTNFFKTDITQLVVDSKLFTNQTTPFGSTDPSRLVLGATPDLGVAGVYQWWEDTNGNGAVDAGEIVSGSAIWNGLDSCGGGQPCDFLLQTDASTGFDYRVPVPGTIALLGLGLTGLGWTTRRRKTN